MGALVTYNKYIMRNSTSRHHIVPKSRGGSNIKENIIRMKDNKHRALHILFSNDDPVEQLWNLTFKINYTALADEFKEDVRLLLSETDPEYYYKKGILVPKHYKDYDEEEWWTKCY